MLHRRSIMRRRWGRVLDSKRSREFEVEDVSVELLQESAIDSTSQPGALSLLPVRATTPRVNSPNLDNETYRPVVIDALSLPFIESPEISYLPLEIAMDLIPPFDGKSSSLFNFTTQCRSVDSLIKPSDRGNLSAIIRSKIEGPAYVLLANRPQLTTVDEIVGLLKEVYSRSFDFYHICEELSGLHQETHETVQFYGSRACEILWRGLEAAKDKFNSEQLIGVVALLNEMAVTNFTRGLQNQNLRFVVSNEQDATLNSAIIFASRLERFEREANELSKQFSSPAVFRDVKVITTDIGSFKCFNCDQEGHYRNNCPRLKRNIQNLPAPERLRCRFYRKAGHTESRCFRKRNGDNTGMRNTSFTFVFNSAFTEI